MFKETIVTYCDKCEYVFELYRDSLVKNKDTYPQKISDTFFRTYLCPICFFSMYKMINHKFIIQIGSLRFPCYNDDAWVVANLL